MDALKRPRPTTGAYLSVLFIMLAGMLFSGCATDRSITFACDPQINQGQLLPVDIIYVTRYQTPREIIAIGPDQWFNSSERMQWETRQTLGLRGSETKTVHLNQRWLKGAKLLIIFADFKGVKNPQSQQVIIDNLPVRKEHIHVMPQQLVVDSGG